MRVRLRAPNGTHTLALEDVATVGVLTEEIRSKASISGDFTIRCGFPPKILELPSPDTLLIDLPVKLNGEQLILDEAPGGSRAPKSAAGPSSGPISNSSGTLFRAEERETPKSDRQKPNFFAGAPQTPKYESTPPRNQTEAVKGNEPVLRVPNNPGWSMTLRVMEDDNSCMFRAVNYAFGRGIDMMTELRNIVATQIRIDEDLAPTEQRFSDVILGMSREKYCERIQRPDTWGGYIDLTILAEYFGMTICSISVDDGSIVKYNEGQSNYGILVYSGIHYDCIAASANINDPDLDVTVFDSFDPSILETASKLCQILKGKNYATNTSTFKIRCNECGKILSGEKGASKHNEQTGHSAFEQIA